MENPLPRLGCFFLLVGFVLVLLFIASIIGKGTEPTYLLVGIVALVLGYALNRNKTSSESTRFSAIRKVRQRARERKDGKKEEKTEEKS